MANSAIRADGRVLLIAGPQYARSYKWVCHVRTQQASRQHDPANGIHGRRFAHSRLRANRFTGEGEGTYGRKL